MISLRIAFWYFLCLQTSAAEQTEDCLVAVSKGTDGTSVILDCGGDASAGYEALLRGHHLSPLIGSPRALVTLNTTTTNKSSFAIFLPLLNSLGVVELTYNKTDGWAHSLTMIDVDCKIISVHQVLQTYFTACLDSNEKLVMHRLYNTMYLNASYARQFQDSISVGSGNNFSNIAYATLQNGGSLERLYVAVGSHIYSIAPFDQHITTFRGGLPSDNCHTLEYAGEWVLLATCTDGGETYNVYYDINDQSVLNTTQGTDTVLFLCPPSEGRLTVNNTRGVVLYRNWSSSADTEFILHDTVHSGMCFGNSKMASLSFAYSNNEAGVYAINISHRADNNVHLSSNTCLSQNCQPVFTLGKYLVVQERKWDDTVATQVRDPARNYSIEYEMNSDVAGIALINHPQVEKNDTRNATNNDPHNATTHNDTNNDPHNAATIVVIIAVPLLGCAVFALVFSSIVLIVCRFCRGNRRQYTIEDKEWHSLSPIIPRNRQEDGSEREEEPCPNDGQISRPLSQRSNAAGGSQTSLTTGSDEAMPPIDCTQPHDRNLSQGHIAPEEDQNIVDPEPESRQPVIHNPARGPGDGAEENYHPIHDPQTN